MTDSVFWKNILYSGLRRGEILTIRALTTQDIDIGKKTIKIDNVVVFGGKLLWSSLTTHGE